MNKSLKKRKHTHLNVQAVVPVTYVQGQDKQLKVSALVSYVFP